MRVGRIRGNQTSGALRTSLLTLWAQPSHHKVEPWGSGDRGTGCPQLPLLEGGCLAEEGGGGEGVQALLQQKRLSLWAVGRGPQPPHCRPARLWRKHSCYEYEINLPASC